ncbi:MAG: flagellar hook-associated protein FlgK [Pseudochelatococcus sp.]|jgi:flagellar hook-associated protein 1 FlgK|uniref:flagellar hook-associated protein FlgK n=1 Tax=Pseudochelatococcus sp. TaxID=2020869 RepID=UPI003D8CC876
MSLNAALNAAQLSLSANSKRISVSARNVAGAGDLNYSRKLAPLITYDGGVYAAGPTRAADMRLYERYIEAMSASTREQALLSGLTRLSDTVGDTGAGTSLVARLGALNDALTEYANAPGDANLARAAINGAKDLASSLNEAAKVVDEVRSGAEQDIGNSVSRINELLKEFGEVNSRVVRGSATGADITDDLDRRDMLVAQLSEEVGITVLTRANNDVALYTDGGVTLFETNARTVILDPATKQVFIDGVQVTGSGAPMPSKSGRLVGLVGLRDTVAKEYGEQLDNLALGLITAFREIDPAATDPDRMGLFSYDGAASVDLPIAAGDLAGLARTIVVNAAVDPAAGGDPNSLRDGINYAYNTESAPAFSDRLFTLLNQFDAPDTALGDKNLLDYAAFTVSSVEAQRKSADAAGKSSEAVLQLVTTSLSNARGVDVNEETALQLELERLFSASAQLISVVDNLFKTLLSIVG